MNSYQILAAIFDLLSDCDEADLQRAARQFGDDRQLSACLACLASVRSRQNPLQAETIARAYDDGPRDGDVSVGMVLDSVMHFLEESRALRSTRALAAFLNRLGLQGRFRAQEGRKSMLLKLGKLVGETSPEARRAIASRFAMMAGSMDTKEWYHTIRRD